RLFFTNPNTAAGIIIATVVGRMSVYTCDQVMVQRFQTTRSLKDSKRAFIINSVGDTIWTLGLTFVGLALFAYFKRHDLPVEISANPDKVFPYFISHVFPTGVIGLVIAAILAASLSSIDSAINSCTSVAMIDFYNRLILKRQLQSHDLSAGQERSQIRISRYTTLGFGIVGVILATQVSRIGMVIKIGNSVIQTFTGPLLGIYLLGMFTERARSTGVLTGGIAGTAVSLYIAFGTQIGFIWPTVFGLITTLVVGYVTSLLTPGSHAKEARQLTWRNVMHSASTDH
ncbi:MAG: hypothetical protein ABJC04_10905, partial [Verrucomicrobiota bacterium]